MHMSSLSHPLYIPCMFLEMLFLNVSDISESPIIGENVALAIC